MSLEQPIMAILVLAYGIYTLATFVTLAASSGRQKGSPKRGTP